MAGIFISYRREDSAGWTGRLAERLKQKFGTESIFMDIDTIQPGTDFTEALRSAVGACDVLLAMIGPEWDIAKNSEGQARLQDPTDWVRTELTTALGRGIPVIPILVGGASLPKLGTLPDDLKKLFQYQTHELTDKRWEYDSNQLMQVLEKVLGGAKPRRSITRTLLMSRSTWVALVILGLSLAFGSIQFFKGMSGPDDAATQNNQGGVSQSRILTPPSESKPTDMPLPSVANPVEKPTEKGVDNQQSAVTQQEVASPVATRVTNTDTSEKAKLTSAASPAGQKGRSLPAGIEVKFFAGDMTFRLVSISLEDHSNDNWLLNTSVLIRNSGKSWHDVFYGERYRLLIGNDRRPPTKMQNSVRLESDTETSGEVAFVVPKTAHRVGLRIGYSDENYTTIPIDLNSGVSRSDAQPPGIPRQLPKPARLDNIYGYKIDYDFRAPTLEQYNVESFLLRISLRITTQDNWTDFNGAEWRIVFQDLPHAPVKTSDIRIERNTYGDAEVLFIVPKSVTQALFRVKERDNWRNVPIDLKAGKS